MNVVDISTRRSGSPLEMLKKLIADIEAGEEPKPQKILVITDSGESYSIYGAGSSEAEEIGLASLGVSLLINNLTSE